MQSAKTITAGEVGDLAERYLARHQASDYQIIVVRDGIREVDGWWEVPIKTSRADVPSYDWINRSVEAAGDMDESEGVHVLFM
jgi:hypothetical protein